MKTQEATCKHPATRLYSWIVETPVDGKPNETEIVICVGCCKCGTILKGGAE